MKLNLTKRNIKLPIVLAVGLLLGATFIYAAVGDSLRLTVANRTADSRFHVDKHGICKIVRNSSGSVEYFLPVKTSAEWLAFRSSVGGIADLSTIDCPSDTVVFKPGWTPFSSDGAYYYVPTTREAFPDSSMQALVAAPLWNDADERNNFCQDLGFTTVDSYVTGTFVSPADNLVALHGSTGWGTQSASLQANSHVSQITCSGRTKIFGKIDINNSGSDSHLNSLGATYYEWGRFGHTPVLTQADPEVWTTGYSIQKLSVNSNTHNQVCKDYGFTSAVWGEPYAIGPVPALNKPNNNAVSLGTSGAMWTSKMANWTGSSWEMLDHAVLNSNITTHAHDTAGLHTTRNYYPVGLDYVECQFEF